MPRKRSWSKKMLVDAVKKSQSYRQVLHKLGLREAGGNYDQVKKYIHEYDLDARHFHGRAWNKGKKVPGRFFIPLEQLLVYGSNCQSFKLKKRLFYQNLKKPKCEMCDWAQISEDGRVPLELDHINGDRHDNRIENLRVLCPNCHSLQPTHRGRNRKKISS
ncbi:MAG: HNH endonuclease [Candidatus Ryanbacteria bacterium]|nr:HNH endonuclease [Candidatus Ryanbacteria bacterium]